MKLDDILTEAPERFKQFGDNRDTMTVAKIAHIAPMMKQAGMDVNGDNVARMLNIPAKYANHLLKQGSEKIESGYADGDDPIAKMVLDFFHAQQYRRNKDQKNSPITSQPKPGAEQVAKRTGLSVEEVQKIAKERWDAIEAKAQQLKMDIKPFWFKASGEDKLGQKKYDPESESKSQAIRRAFKEMTDGFDSAHHGKISAEMVEKHIGINRRTIDKYLEQPEFNDLEAFRVRGRSAGVTDQDRANMYLRNKYK